MAASPMRRLFSIGPVQFYWAAPDRFTHPGLVVWLGQRFARWHSRVFPDRGGHLRLVPVRKRSRW